MRDTDHTLLKRVRGWLENQNIESYIDLLDNSYDIKTYQSKLLEVLKTCDGLLIIESEHYYDSKWTQIERNSAEKKRIPFIKISPKEIIKAIEAQADFNEIEQRVLALI